MVRFVSRATHSIYKFQAIFSETYANNVVPNRITVCQRWRQYDMTSMHNCTYPASVRLPDISIDTYMGTNVFDQISKNFAPFNIFSKPYIECKSPNTNKKKKLANSKAFWWDAMHSNKPANGDDWHKHKHFRSVVTVKLFKKMQKLFVFEFVCDFLFFCIEEKNHCRVAKMRVSGASERRCTFRCKRKQDGCAGAPMNCIRSENAKK